MHDRPFVARAAGGHVIRAGAGLLACCVCAFALDPSLDVSQYAHKAWKISEGFAKGTLHVVAQSPDGYLWLATEAGLLRFDGVRTVEWQPPAGEHLPSRDIRSLVVARDGALWLGTAKGLVRWRAGKLTHYPEFDKYDVHTLLEAREGAIWAAGTRWEAGPLDTGKLCAINSSSVQCFGSDGRFGGFGVTAIYEDSRSNLWFGAGNGLWRWKPGAPEHYPVPELKHYGVANLLFLRRALLDDRAGALLVAGPRGISRFIGGKLNPYPLPSGAPQVNNGSLLRDRDGGLWIGTRGAGLLHIHQGRMDVLAEADGLSSNSVENLFEDREGNIWIATINGLDRFRDYTVATISAKQGLSSPFVMSVLATRDGSVWLATADGVNRLKDGQVTIYRRRDARTKPPHRAIAVSAAGTSRQKPGAVVQEIQASGLPDNYVGSLYQQPDGTIWVSTARGLARFEDGRFSPLSGVHIPAWFLSPVARDRAGNLWITSDQGLYRLYGGKVAEYFPSARVGLRGSLSTLLAVDPVHGGLWVASWQGGVVYFKDGQVRASYGSADGLGDGRVNALVLDADNTLWAATDGGLSRIENGRVATLTSKNGLPCDTAHGVVRDDANSLWVYMACGLVRIPGRELDAWVAEPKRQIQVAVFDVADGVKSHAGVNQFGPRMAKAADGKIWFIPLNGVSVVDPRRLPINSLPPPVVIEQITANGHTYDASVRNGVLRLPSLVRDLTIEYTALSFVAPEKVRFRFKLEGQDKDWREVANDRKVQYSNLAPRDYRFRVTACNNSGVWNQEGATVDFSVAPAYYQMNLFRAACAAVLLALLWGLYRYRLHQIAREFNAHLEGRVDERLRVARDLHDTLLQSFHGLLLRFQGARNLLRGRADDVAQVLDSALEDAAQAITAARDTVQDLRSSTEATNELAKAVEVLGEELAEQQRAASGEAAALSVEVEGASQELHPIVRDEVYRITGEALRNAFRHARAQRIEVEVRYDERKLRVRVRDDGAGMDASVVHEGRAGHYGLPGMRERAAAIGGQLEVWSERGAGTEVELTIPASAAYGNQGGRRFGRFRSGAGTTSGVESSNRGHSKE